LTDPLPGYQNLTDPRSGLCEGTADPDVVDATAQDMPPHERPSPTTNARPDPARDAPRTGGFPPW